MSLDYPGRNLTKPEWGEIQDPSELAEAQVRVCHLPLFFSKLISSIFSYMGLSPRKSTGAGLAL